MKENHAMENITLKLLDHGYVKFIESWGTDESIIEAARMSTDKGFLGWGPFACKASIHTTSQVSSTEDCTVCHGSGSVPGDEKLLAYLYKNAHSTPFEFCGMTIEVQAPIFVFREWHRHRTQSYNEMSARYTPLPDLNYIPTAERLLINSKTNKQAGTIAGADELTEEGAKDFQQSLERVYKEQQALYERALNMGVPKELARIHLPVGRYSRMRASTDLRNWMAFLTLRNAPTAQYEIRVYAEAVHTLLHQKFPRAMEIYDNGK
jgi:thymidylate synthase (FAD)